MSTSSGQLQTQYSKLADYEDFDTVAEFRLPESSLERTHEHAMTSALCNLRWRVWLLLAVAFVSTSLLSACLGAALSRQGPTDLDAACAAHTSQYCP